MSKVLISIVIPVYNQSKELGLALISIQKQTYKSIEVIIVDDGSDNNEELKIQNSEFGFPLRIFRQENKGAPAARNRGFRESGGEYVIFWDADVLAEPEFLESLYNVLQKNKDAVYAYAAYYFGWKKMKPIAFDPERLKENNYIHSTSLVRREVVVKWDENLRRFQDWDFWLTLLENGHKGVFVPKFLFKVIPNKGGISNWLPEFAYRNPWCKFRFFREKVCRYKDAKEIVEKKHGITKNPS